MVFLEDYQVDRNMSKNILLLLTTLTDTDVLCKVICIEEADQENVASKYGNFFKETFIYIQMNLVITHA